MKLCGVLTQPVSWPRRRRLAHRTSRRPPIPFEGGTLTITETADLDKILAFDGKELARNYVVYFDRIVELDGDQGGAVRRRRRRQ